MKSRLFIDGQHLTRQQYVWIILQRSESSLTARQLLPLTEPAGIDALHLDKYLTRLLQRGNVTRDKAPDARYYRYTAIGERPADLRCRGFTPEQTANSIRARWGIDHNADEAQNRSRGDVAPKRNVGSAAPPPLPTLADLIARR